MFACGANLSSQQVCVSHDGHWVVGTDTEGNVSRRPTDLSSDWVPVPGIKLKQVSTYDGNLIWGVAPNGDVFTNQ